MFGGDGRDEADFHLWGGPLIFFTCELAVNRFSGDTCPIFSRSVCYTTTVALVTMTYTVYRWQLRSYYLT